MLAPQSTITGRPPPNQVIDVELTDEEEVEWIWPTLPGGQRYVSGFPIHEKLD